MKKRNSKSNPGTKPEERCARGQLHTFVIRFFFIFLHAYVAFVHFFMVEEGKQFFRDATAGRQHRLKQERIERLFPNLKVKK